MMLRVNQLIGFGARRLVGGPATDPHFANVVLLVGCDGADGSTTFTDESPVGRTLTAVGNAQIDTAQFKYGASSGLFDGTGDGILADNSADFQFGSGQFTIEFFFHINSRVNGQIVVAFYDSNSQRSWLVRLTGTSEGNSAIELLSSSNGTTVSTLTAGAATHAASTWYHFAVDRDGGGTSRIYLNGAKQTTTGSVVGTLHNSTGKFSIGGATTSGSFSGSTNYNGWIDELRITKGVARYASDAGFTPPTAAFPRS